MTNGTLQFGLLGCSKIARKHAVPLHAGIEGAQLAAVCDTARDRADTLGAEFGVPAFASLEEMLAGPDLDVVCVLTPSGLHAEHGLTIASAGKHVVVEKPMALRLEDADRLIETCDLRGVRLFVVKQNRYNLPIQKLKAAVDQGRFGRMVLGTVRVRWTRRQAYYDEADWRGTWAMDGGVITNQAAHHIDMLEWLMGDVVTVKANIATRVNDIEVEDTATALLTFDNGALGIIEATTAARPSDLEGSVSILGEGGTVVVGGFAMDRLDTWQFETPHPDDAQIMEAAGCNPPHATGYGHQMYLEDVVHAIHHGHRGLVEGIEGRRSIALINAIYESAETNREITMKFRPQRCKLGLQPEG